MAGFLAVASNRETGSTVEMQCRCLERCVRKTLPAQASEIVDHFKRGGLAMAVGCAEKLNWLVLRGQADVVSEAIEQASHLKTNWLLVSIG